MLVWELGVFYGLLGIRHILPYLPKIVIFPKNIGFGI